MTKHHRRRRRSKLNHPIGTPAGLLRPAVGATDGKVECHHWNGTHWVHDATPTIATMEALHARGTACWINYDSVPSLDTLLALKRIFALHPLAMEDVQHPPRRAKVEPFGQVLFALLPAPDPAAGDLETEQLSLFLGTNFVLTIGERPGGDCLQQVRRQLTHDVSGVYAGSAAALCFAIVDSVIDRYFPLVTRVGDRLDAIEEHIMTARRPIDLNLVRAVKWDIHRLRAAMWPMRDAVTALMTMEAHFDMERRLLLRSALDHVIRLTDQLDSERMMASEISDIALAMVNVRIGEVTKVLTVIATIFIPMTFLASVYGMNFRFMPELEWRWGYPAVLGAMALVAIGSLIAFRRRGWIGRLERRDELGSPEKPARN